MIESKSDVVPGSHSACDACMRASIKDDPFGALGRSGSEGVGEGEVVGRNEE